MGESHSAATRLNVKQWDNRIQHRQGLTVKQWENRIQQRQGLTVKQN